MLQDLKMFFNIIYLNFLLISILSEKDLEPDCQLQNHSESALSATHKVVVEYCLCSAV